jgi:hypothetical protein
MNAPGLALSAPQQAWETICRRDFGLTAKETATLLAIVAYVLNVGTPMLREHLDALAVENPREIDLTAPGRLERMGLLRLGGYRECRSYVPTAEGLRRLELL